MARWHYILVTFLVLCAAAIIVSSYPQLSQTADEFYHLFCGMQWWREGKYTYHPMNPPLSRIIVSALPYFIPAKVWLEPEELSASRYIVTTILMRVGVLPVFICSAFMVWRASGRLFQSPAVGLWALAVYVSIPTVLGHAGLATTDMIYTVMFFWAFLAWMEWFKTPTRRSAIMMGLAVGCMVASKFSGIPHFAGAVILIMVFQLLVNDTQSVSLRLINKHHLMTGLYSVIIAVLVLALVYRFSLESFWAGLQQLWAFNKRGFAIWMYKPLHNQAVWYFFPVVFWYKTPIALHIAYLSGIVVSVREMIRDTQKSVYLYPLLAALGVVLSSMLSNVNLGIRHILPVFPLLAMMAGYGLHCLWQRWSVGRWRIGMVLALSLLFWQVAELARYYPEQFTYFNEFAGEHPENIVVDSDFDWGHSIVLLSKAVKTYDIKEIQLCPKTIKTMKKNLRNLIKIKHLPCPRDVETAGWLAISRERMIYASKVFSWLKKYPPIKVGQSMYLYYVPKHPAKKRRGHRAH